MSKLSADKYLLYFNNGIGDFISCIPTIRALTSKLGVLYFYSDCNCQEVIYEIAKYIPNLVILKDEDFEKTNVKHLVSINSWFDEHVVRMQLQLGAEEIIVPTFDYDNPWIDCYFDIAKSFDPTLEILDFVDIEKLYSKASDLVAIRSSKKTQLLVGIHRDTKREKKVSLKIFKRILNQMRRFHDIYVVEFGLDNSAETLGDSDIRGESLSVSICYVSKLDVFVGVDSCFRHVADLCRIPQAVIVPNGWNKSKFPIRFAPGSIIYDGQDKSEECIRSLTIMLNSSRLD